MRGKDRVAPIGRAHLTDDQLMEAYVFAGENSHLSACRSCAVRFDDLVRTLAQVREDAVRDADAVFTAERLHHQRDRIIRRLDRHGHPGEVVMFPARPASPAVQRVLGPARRWVAVGAAAGLAAGLFLGFAMDRRIQYGGVNTALQQTASSVGPMAWQVADGADDQFLLEIEDALMGSRAVELRSIDTMTTPVEIREASYPR